MNPNDNYTLNHPTENTEANRQEPLYGKSIYGFGDSLVYGHSLGIGMLDFVTQQNKMQYTKYAINGATVITREPVRIEGISGMVLDIASQIVGAAVTQPDFICFDGLTNDAYDDTVNHHLGMLSDNYDGNYYTTTFIGAFENICFNLRYKYQNSNIIYICPHKMPSRTKYSQHKLQYWARTICNKWSIPFIDIYNSGGINTCISGMQNDYSYNNNDKTTGGNGTHLNDEGYKLWYAPLIEATLKSLI